MTFRLYFLTSPHSPLSLLHIPLFLCLTLHFTLLLPRRPVLLSPLRL
jgi:hypothetical protein